MEVGAFLRHGQFKSVAGSAGFETVAGFGSVAGLLAVAPWRRRGLLIPLATAPSTPNLDVAPDADGLGTGDSAEEDEEDDETDDRLDLVVEEGEVVDDDPSFESYLRIGLGNEGSSSQLTQPSFVLGGLAGC